MVALLELHGIRTKMLRTRRVGYVVYEDEFQVCAEPFRAEIRVPRLPWAK
jgi:hypothetical protein